MGDPKHPDDFGYTAEGVIQWQRAKIKFQADEIERLREALRPFVEPCIEHCYETCESDEERMEDCICFKARAALG